ncbi:MAG: hypothetical protein ACOVS5_03475 [Oligoflexus sp.]
MIRFTRPILLGLCLIISASASARSYRYKQALSAELDATSSERYTSASVAINNRKNQLTVSLQPLMPPCAEGMMCIQVMPEPIVYTLDKARTTVDPCGVIRTQASFDQRPVDGVFFKVIVNDNRFNRCPTFIALPNLELIIEEKFFSRLEEREVSQRDVFETDTIQMGKVQKPGFEGVIRAELNAESSNSYSSASLYLDGRKGVVELSLQPVMPHCPEGLMCAQRMPEPISYSLDHAQTEIDECDIIRTTARIDQRSVDGVFLQVVISNNRNNRCPTFAPLPALSVVVEQSFFNRRQGREESSVDTFTADDFAMIKPAK